MCCAGVGNGNEIIYRRKVNLESMNLYLISPFVCADIDEKEIYLWWKWMIFPPSMRCGGICETLQESHHDFSTFKVLKKTNSTINLPNGFISVDNRNQNPSVLKRCIEKAIKWIGMILHSLKISDVDAGCATIGRLQMWKQIEGVSLCCRLFIGKTL